MRCLTLWLASMQLCGTLTASAQKIIRHDLRFDQLMPSDAVVEKLADGVWLEGPVWNRTEGFLLFSDMPHNSIFKWQEGKGVSLFLRPSGYAGSAPFEGHFPGSNGLAYDTQGRLVLCDQGGRAWRDSMPTAPRPPLPLVICASGSIARTISPLNPTAISISPTRI